MTKFRCGRMATTLAATLLLAGMSLGAPTSGARAASMVDAASSSSSEAVSPVEMQRRGGFRGGGMRHGGRGGFRGGRGGGGVGAAVGLGAAALIIGGAAAAAAASQPRECWVERRWVDTPYGPERRRVRICE